MRGPQSWPGSHLNNTWAVRFLGVLGLDREIRGVEVEEVLFSLQGTYLGQVSDRLGRFQHSFPLRASSVGHGSSSQRPPAQVPKSKNQN